MSVFYLQDVLSDENNLVSFSNNTHPKSANGLSPSLSKERGRASQTSSRAQSNDATG